MTALPTTPGGWEILYADAPWSFAGNSAAKPGRNVRRHYQTMTVAEIAALPVRDIAAKKALLLMWITVPHAHRAAEVIEAWGFKPKSQVVWVKSRIATGYWARNRHELLHIATRGGLPCPVPALFPDSVIEAPTRQHSRKPDAIPAIIDARLPGLSKLELFARAPRDGWQSWGNEVEKFS